MAVSLVALHSQAEIPNGYLKKRNRKRSIFHKRKIIFVKGSLLKNVISRLLPVQSNKNDLKN